MADRLIEEEGVREAYDAVLADPRFKNALSFMDGDREDDSNVFSLLAAAYWFYSDHHRGQWSDEYRIMSMIDYRPGLAESGPEEGSVDAMIYDDACDIEGCEHPRIGEPEED